MSSILLLGWPEVHFFSLPFFPKFFFWDITRIGKKKNVFFSSASLESQYLQSTSQEIVWCNYKAEVFSSLRILFYDIRE